MLMPRMRNEEFFTINIRHLPTDNITKFEGWVTEFSDKYTSDWTPTKVYGRMDPLATFTGTSRIISIGFDVVSDNKQQAQDNLARVGQLIRSLYPVYEQGAGTAGRVGKTLKAAPLIGLKWSNLISDSATGGELIGYLGGLTYGPDMSQGGFGTSIDDPNRAIQTTKAMGGRITKSDVMILADGTTESRGVQQFGSRTVDARATVLDEITQITETAGLSKAYIPKKLSLSFDFTVLHTHLNGWEQTSDGLQNGWTFANSAVDYSYPYLPTNARGIPQDEYQLTRTFIDSGFSPLSAMAGDITTEEISQAEAELILGENILP